MKAKFNLRNGEASPSSSFSIMPTITIFALFSIFLSAQHVNGQQRLIWLFKPATSSQSTSRNYQLGNHMSMSSSDNEIDTGTTNFRPIYFFSQFNDRSTHVPVPNSARFLYHPQIAPIIIPDYDYGHSRPKPNSMFPQYFSNHLEQMEPYNGGAGREPGFNNNKIDNVFMLNTNQHKFDGISKEEREDDDNNSSSSSGSSEFGMESDLRPHDDNQLDVSPPPSLTSTKNVIITHPHQRCILEGHQARFDPITGGCHTVGTRGPCGKFMIFTTIPNDNLNGYCDCDYDSFDRPMALLGGKCQFLYTQAVCYPGYWLTSITSNGDPICEENPCQVESSSSFINSKNSLVLFKGECVPLNSPSMHCRREGEVVLFPKGSTEPACGFPKSTKRIYRRQISNVSRLMCRPGMRRHRVTKRCVRTRAIVFH